MNAPATPTIRQLTPNDGDVLFEIFAQAQKASAVPIGPQWSRRDFSDEMSHEGWVAQTPTGEVTSFLLYRDVGAAFEISMLVTAFGHLRQGAMSRLLTHFVASLRIGQTSPKPVWLEVHANNLPARELYRKFGFIEVGQRPRYYSDGGTAVLYNYG